jgi:hypothetical protein
MKHFHCDFRVQQLNLHKNWHISFLLVKNLNFVDQCNNNNNNKIKIIISLPKLNSSAVDNLVLKFPKMLYSRRYLRYYFDCSIKY